jgi:hypothetical protein
VQSPEQLDVFLFPFGLNLQGVVLHKATISTIAGFFKV